MTTKDQERKALEAIKKILAGLDEDGYVRTAMLGVIEDAEENIENDWAMSRYDAWQSAEQKYEHAAAELREEKVKTCRVIFEKDQEIEALQNKVAALEEINHNLNKQVRDAEAEAIDEAREVEIETTDGDTFHGRFAQVRYIDDHGFRFVNIVERNGWTTSYKLDDIKKLVIE